MENKKQLYTISWKQPYTEYELLQEAITEIKLENSDLTEANNLIKYIMEIK
jgi:hypothetical protein